MPLLTPLRQYLPAPYGNTFADLLQPDVRVIVDMGYGTGEYANIPTPASLFELPTRSPSCRIWRPAPSRDRKPSCTIWTSR